MFVFMRWHRVTPLVSRKSVAQTPAENLHQLVADIFKDSPNLLATIDFKFKKRVSQHDAADEFCLFLARFYVCFRGKPRLVCVVCDSENSSRRSRKIREGFTVITWRWLSVRRKGFNALVNLFKELAVILVATWVIKRVWKLKSGEANRTQWKGNCISRNCGPSWDLLAVSKLNQP